MGGTPVGVQERRLCWASIFTVNAINILLSQITYLTQKPKE